jgi:hypothetical protein
MGRSLDDEIKEAAFHIWRKCGQSPDRTVKALREKGHMVTRQTIDAWKNERKWVVRAAEADAVEHQAKDANLTSEERLIAVLVSEQEKYEQYFKTLTIHNRDHQAVYACASLASTIQNIRQKSATYKAETFTAFMRDLIGWLNLNDPESVPAIEKNFDDFIAFAKEKYRT